MFAGRVYKKDHSLLAGVSFGLTSGVITTLGIIIGIGSSGEVTAKVIITAIIAVAIADSLSDSTGMHLAKEAEGSHSSKQLWGETIATFLGKFFFTLLFIFPVLLFPLPQSLIISAILAFFLIALLSALLAKLRKEKIWKAVLGHTLITVVVVVLSYLVGSLTSRF